MQELLQKLNSELRGSWRYRWHAMVIAWVMCALGWAGVYAYPDTYESTATVYVDTSSALKPLLEKMTVNADVLSRVDMVTTAMLGRPQLEEVARQTDLHLRADSDNSMDSLVAEMRSRINIDNDRRRDPNLFSISYRDAEPDMAKSVVTTLLNIFVEDSLGENRDDALQAQEFLKTQLAELGDELTVAETALAEFKRSNVGQMPGESGDYYSRLQSAMQELESIEASLRQQSRRRDVLRQRLAGENPTNELGSPQSEIDIKISEYQSQLSQLQLRFTDRHPDVIATKRTLEQLEQRRREQLDALTSDDGIGVASDNPVFQNLQIELTNVNVELATLNEKRTTLVKRVRQLEESVDILPQIEADLARLTRDYNVKQAQYQALLERLEMAELSESAEQSEDVRFRIIDPPSYSSDPVAPNRPLLLVGTFLASLAASGFVAFLLNQVNPVFSDSRSVRVVTSLPILGSVQVLNSTEHRRWRRGQLTAFAFGILSLFIVFVVVFLLHDAGSRALQSII